MSSEMAVRVARRICRALAGAHVNPDAVLTDGPVREIGQRMYEYYLPAAMAAIEEMRVPTDKMLSVGRYGPVGNVPYDRDAEIVWTDMVDEALRLDEISAPDTVNR